MRKEEQKDYSHKETKYWDMTADQWKYSKDIHGRGRSGEEQSNKGTRNWGNEDNKYGNEEAAEACEVGTDKEETGRLRDN